MDLLRRNLFQMILCCVAPFALCACSDSEDGLPKDEPIVDPDEPTVTVSPVTNLKVERTLRALEFFVSCTAPSEAISVKISCVPKDGDENDAVTERCVLGSESRDVSATITVDAYGPYQISAVAMDNYGRLSEPVTLEATPLEKDEKLFLQWSDEMMTSMLNLYFGKSPRDCWNSSYPNATGPYWDGDAVVWGQGAGLSAYVALRGASVGVEGYEEKYAEMTDRMFNSINRFITTDNGLSAYAVYPQNGNDRFYDDNVWIGLDMAELYGQTKERRFLDKAIMVWEYLMDGYDDTCGGGIHWKEMNGPSTTKHTCSTAPTAVLGCMLYRITGEQVYLDTAIELYNWLLKYMQDPVDHLFWDNINPEMKVEKSKYSYNSGQPLLAACLLRRLTGDESYLDEAREIARSAYYKWFSSYDSDVLHRNISILNETHAWFASVMFRGFVELYRLDESTKLYVDAFADTMRHAWLSSCRNKQTNLLNYSSFKGEKSQSSWEILQEGGCLEMLARLARLENEGLLSE